MAIALDGTSNGFRSWELENHGTTHSQSHTVSTSDNTVMFALIGVASTFTTLSSNISATYAGASMTKIGELQYTSRYRTIAAFYKVNPSTGSNTLAFSWTGSAGCYAMGRSYTGVDTSAPVRTSSWQTVATASTPSISIPTSTTDVILDVVLSVDANSGATGTGHSILYQRTTSSAMSLGAFGHVASPGSSPLSIGWSTAYAVQGGFSIVAYEPPASTGNFFNFF